MFNTIVLNGEVPERSKGADCKSVGLAFEGPNPSLSTKKPYAGDGVWLFFLSVGVAKSQIS